MSDRLSRYYGLNDFNLRWIPENNWTYTSKPLQGLYVALKTLIRESVLTTDKQDIECQILVVGLQWPRYLCDY